MTLSKPSKNSHNPRNSSKTMDFAGWRFCSSAEDRVIRKLELAADPRCDWFDGLVERLGEFGASYVLPVSDDILCVDLDHLNELPAGHRQIWLLRAKRETLLRVICLSLQDLFTAFQSGDDFQIEHLGGPVVYFVSIGDLAVVKRLHNQLRTSPAGTADRGARRSACLLLPGTKGLEAELHQRFAPHRLAREWFKLSDDLRKFIAEHK